MGERTEQRSHLLWAFCPKCRSAMGQTDIVCPNCGYNFPPDPPPPDVDAITYQFDIRLLFYLMVLTALIGSACRLLGRGAWLFAGPMFVSGILIWRTRKVRYAALPGLAIGFAVGELLTLSADPLDRVFGGICLATIIGCPINAWLKGFPRSGCLAIVLGIASMFITAWLVAALRG